MPAKPMAGHLTDRRGDASGATADHGGRPLAQWLLSALFVGFVAVKAAEALIGLEAWPLTNVSMFLDRRPPDVVPIRARLWGVRNGETFELLPVDLRLSEDEFLTRLRDDPDFVGACSALVQTFNRRVTRIRAGHQRVTGAFAEREEIPRPGIPREPSRVRVECAIEERPATSG